MSEYNHRFIITIQFNADVKEPQITKLMEDKIVELIAKEVVEAYDPKDLKIGWY